jgi:hypothetical protein
MIFYIDKQYKKQTNDMQLRSGRITNEKERMLENRRTNRHLLPEMFKEYLTLDFRTIRKRILHLEKMLVLTGYQTLTNMRVIRSVFNKTDHGYAVMLIGFIRIYEVIYD